MAILTKLLLVCVTVCISMAYLSYSFYGSKTQAQDALRGVQSTLSSLQSSYDKQSKACLVADNISVELQQENKKIEEEKEGLLDSIDKLPAKSHPGTNVSQTRTDVNEEIDIDAKLPDSIISLSKQAYDNYKGKANADAR